MQVQQQQSVQVLMKRSMGRNQAQQDEIRLGSLQVKQKHKLMYAERPLLALITVLYDLSLPVYLSGTSRARTLGRNAARLREYF